MKAQTTSESVSALHEILNWSSSRPDWQKDALRRIITKGTIDQADIEELNHLCRAKHEAASSDYPALAGEALDVTHIPPSPGSENSVNLVSIGDLKCVNRLPQNQSITFGVSPGLTVIYGDNGSGKSGYVRVIKKACRTRGALPEILPDAFSSESPVTSTGSLTFRIAGKDQSVSWRDNQVCDPRLSNIFVFDSSTANNYLEQDGPATFTPQGLDVLPKLTKLCDAINQKVRIEINNLNNEIGATAKNWTFKTGTAVGILIANLSAETTEIAVEALAGLNEAEKKRLRELGETLKADPKKKAKETRASKARLEAFAGKVREASANLADGKIVILKKLIDDDKEAKETAKAFAAGQFDSSELPGTRDLLWRKLWEAARDFSVSAAYEGKEFPVTNEEARCVLCQQQLEPAAATRLKAFEAFCKDQSQQLAAEAARRLKSAIEKIELMAALAGEYTKVDADLATATEEEVGAIVGFVTKADERLLVMKKWVENRIWIEPSAIIGSPEDFINLFCTALAVRAQTEESADDPRIREKLEGERDELADREWIGRVKVDVLSQIKRYQLLEKLAACQNDVATMAITKKNSDLTKLLVTDEFCKRFKAETEELGLRTLNVKLQEIRGSKAETKFGLRFEEGSRFSVREVASEGEQRCIALAAFLAELSQASHQSALVFDDPASSYDHWHRERIAARLVEESKVRQVIVFTHDAVFLNDLYANSEETSTPAQYYFLDWKGSQPGWCYEGLPWDCKSPEDRLDKLEKKQREIAKTWGTRPSQNDIASMRETYGFLRATIERIVERVVFADVVFRFRSYVKLKDLSKVVGFSDVECGEINRLFKKCCDVTESHDSPQAKQAAVPEPKDLKNDIDATRHLLMNIRTRQKT